MRTPTARWRALPDFIIFGAQKSGTTSLFKYLCAHPQVRRPFGQEPVFFSHERKYARGTDYYRINFPIEVRPWPGGTLSEKRITGEASGEYLYYPTAPERIALLVPQVKLVAVLREPAARTISHYFHNTKLGLENRSIEHAIADEINWHSATDPDTGPSHRQFGQWGSGHAYLGRSLDARHLDRWFARFPSESLLIIDSERLFRNSGEVMREVAEFLRIETDPFSGAFERHNAGAIQPHNDRLHSWLGDVFAGPNTHLRRTLDENLGPRSPELGWA